MILGVVYKAKVVFAVILLVSLLLLWCDGFLACLGDPNETEVHCCVAVNISEC